MMQANFRGSLGQAYTDMPGNYSGALKEIINLSLNNNFERAVFISTLNAILRYLGYISGTIHCKDKQPEECASHLLDYIRERFSKKPKIAFIGMQPAMVEILAEHFKIRVIDLDPDNIGEKKFGVLVEDSSQIKEVLSWADLVFATGTTVVNNTINQLFRGKPIVFYGVTIAGIAFLKGYERYCFCSS